MDVERENDSPRFQGPVNIPIDYTAHIDVS